MLLIQLFTWYIAKMCELYNYLCFLCNNNKGKRDHLYIELFYWHKLINKC